MNTKKMRNEAKKLYDKAQALSKEAEKIEQEDLLPKYQYLIGTCYKLKDKYDGEKWDIYYLVKEVTHVYKQGRNYSATLTCFSFEARNEGASFIFKDTQFHDTLKHLRAKQISSAEFDEALESAYAKIQLAYE